MNSGCHKPDTRAIFITLNTKIEQISKLFEFLLRKLVIAGFAPSAALLTLVNFVVYDFGAESYYLPTPMLYVFYEV